MRSAITHEGDAELTRTSVADMVHKPLRHCKLHHTAWTILRRGPSHTMASEDEFIYSASHNITNRSSIIGASKASALHICIGAVWAQWSCTPESGVQRLHVGGVAELGICVCSGANDPGSGPELCFMVHCTPQRNSPQRLRGIHVGQWRH